VESNRFNLKRLRANAHQREPIMNIYWKSTVSSGSFTSASSWVQGVVPGAGDVAELTTSGVTAFVGSPDTVLGVNVVSGATLTVTTSAFTATEGTATGANHGLIKVAGQGGSGGQLNLGGILNNPGTIKVFTGGAVNVQTFDATLKGGGVIFLQDPTDDNFINVPASLTLTNVDNTIVGGGDVQGLGTLINLTSGIVNANQPATDPLRLKLPVKNTGLLESTSSGALIIENNVDNTGGGVIKAFDHGSVDIFSAVVVGGTMAQVTSAATLGFIDVTLDGTGTHPVTISGTYVTDDRLNLEGVINNSGGTVLDGSFGTVLAAQAVGTSTSVTLQGKGFITLKRDAPIEGGGSPVTLVNVNNTIAGDGTIGGAGLKLNNKAGGLIEANGSGSVLVIDTGADPVVNGGTMAATVSSTLFIGGKLINTGTLAASGGLIDCAGTVTGGKALISSAGIVDFAAASTAATTFAAAATGKLLLEDSGQYTGIIGGFGATQSIDLADFDITGAQKVSFSLGVLTLKNTAGQVVHLHFSGAHTLASFTLSNDSNFNGTDDGTKITGPPAPTKPQTPLDNLAGLFSQFMASWTNPIAALTGEMRSPLASEPPTAIGLPRAPG
jgi:hypothetical protein